MDSLQRVLDKRWRNTCKVVFGEDAGPLSEYEVWLRGLIQTPKYRKSSVSGKEIAYSTFEYQDGSKWIGFDEVNFNKKFEPLSINDMKDIDSLAESIQERVLYAGNIILGNSAYVEKSSNISDSFYMYETGILTDCKYLAYCNFGRQNEDLFGTHAPGESSFCIRCTQTVRLKRGFEAWNCINSSDCYYSYNLIDCNECFFCFNLKNRRHSIGNLGLERTKYLGIKRKLLSEITQELKSKKRLPSLLELVGRSRERMPGVELSSEESNEESNREPMERAFSNTTGLVLGKQLKGIEEYSAWLKKHTRTIKEYNSAISGKRILSIPIILSVPPIPEERTITLSEGAKFGELASLGKEDVEAISMSNVHEKIGRIAYFVVDALVGENSNLIDCTYCLSSVNCYRSSAPVYSKNCGYTFWPRTCSDLFGCDSMLDSSFSINCYFSVKLTRCLEMDACRDCSDSYFSHNCENVRDSMFCFNSKNLRRAVGNVELPRDKYESVKSSLLSQISEELGRTGDFGWDIYNIGAGKRRQRTKP
ncbi:MAG: hypothetical protein ABIF01_03760 [Candidatus Micrarchaeota archaeon]